METDNNTPNNSRDQNVYAAPDASSVIEKKKKRFRFLELIVVIGILCILIGMLLPATRRGVSPAARRVQCLNHMRQIALAMHNYESAHGHFPPAYVADENGKPMHSWRVLLLPYLEHKALYEQYNMDEPWDGPNNSKLHDEYVSIYRCPSSNGTKNCSDYLLITGDGTGFVADKTLDLRDISDGSSNTIMLVEISDADEHWMKPQDISADQFLIPTLEQMETNHPDVRNVALFDGSTHSIATDVPQEELRKLVLIADGELVDIRDL